jgi:hypothetical protein
MIQTLAVKQFVSAVQDPNYNPACNRRRPAPIICKPEPPAKKPTELSGNTSYSCFLANNPKQWESKLVSIVVDTM